MAQNWSGWCWYLCSASSLAIGGAIAFSGDCTRAQLTPDGTLPNNSIVTPQGNTRLIEGGTQVGTNLLHSFTQFSVPAGNTAYFNNALTIQNIFSRVTGESASDIHGVIKANGTANLFLLNPNGILFGPNARLDIGGSFLASTASRLNFADGTSFSATAHPTTPPLLTVSVPIGLQFGGTAGGIRVQGSGLSVQPGKMLALVGGDITLEGGDLAASGEPNLVAPGGRIELGSVADVGEVSLNHRGNSWVLGYDRVDAFRDILLDDGAFVDASGSGGGDIQIQGAKFDLTEGSYVFADTRGTGAGAEVLVHTTGAVTLSDESLITADVSGSGTGGNLTIEAGALALSDGSQITADVLKTGTGIGGNLTIATGQLSIRGDRSLVSATTYGQGNAGNLTVTASDLVELSDDSLITADVYGSGTGGNLTIEAGAIALSDGSLITADVLKTGTGTGGNLTITAEAIALSDDSLITADVSGSGTGGNLTIEAGAIALSDRSLITADVLKTGTGPGGNLTIATGAIALSDDSLITADVSGSGTGGNLTIEAGAIALSDRSQITADVLKTGTGPGGNLTIATGQLSIRGDGSLVSASTYGQGNAGNLAVTASDLVELVGLDSGLVTQTEGAGDAGNLTIATRRLSVQDGAQVLASTVGSGQGGDLSVTASDLVELMRRSPDGLVPSGLFTQTEGARDAGNLTITTRRLSVGDGAQVSAATFGQGKGGELQVNATESVNLFGVGLNRSPSGLFTRTSKGGQAGNITVDTSAFRIADGAIVDSRTLSAGNGGNITVKADTFEAVNGGQLLASAFRGSSGRAGNITVNTNDSVTISGSAPTSRRVRIGGDLFVDDEPATSGLFVRSQGSGDAGNLQLTARYIRLDKQGEITAQTASGQGGDIKLQAQDLLLLRRGSEISTSAGTEGTGGDGGNIDIDTQFIVAVPEENSDITANAFQGKGGRVQITAQGIFGTQFRKDETRQSDITASSRFGVDGVVEINTPDIDPSRGLVALPAQPTETEMAQGCQPGGSQASSKFIVTGRGGLPATPSEALSSDAIQVDWVTLNPGVDDRSSPATGTSPTSPTRAPIVEAQGWVIGPNGEVVLTASSVPVLPHSSWQTPAKCGAPKTPS